jgi:hypothetical protein
LVADFFQTASREFDFHEKLNSSFFTFSKRDVARSNWWEYKELQQHPDGKVVPLKVYPSVAESPSWPAPLHNFTSSKGEKINLPEEFARLYKEGQVASIIVVSQKRPLVHSFVNSFTSKLVQNFPTLPIYDVRTQPILLAAKSLYH